MFKSPITAQRFIDDTLTLDDRYLYAPALCKHFDAITYYVDPWAGYMVRRSPESCAVYLCGPVAHFPNSWFDIPLGKIVLSPDCHTVEVCFLPDMPRSFHPSTSRTLSFAHSRCFILNQLHAPAIEPPTPRPPPLTYHTLKPKRTLTSWIALIYKKLRVKSNTLTLNL